jgi:hypothetical protein
MAEGPNDWERQVLPESRKAITVIGNGLEVTPVFDPHLVWGATGRGGLRPPLMIAVI